MRKLRYFPTAFLCFAVGIGSVWLVTPVPLIVSVPETAPQSTVGSGDVETVTPDTDPETEQSTNQLDNLITSGQARVSQTVNVWFPIQGKVTVQTLEEIGQFPRIRFLRAASKTKILESTIKDGRGFLIPRNDVDDLSQPLIRFSVIKTGHLAGPLVLAVGLTPGASDNGFFAVLFGEINGKLVRLIDRPIASPIQGGFYAGYLNKKLGYGLLAWDFIWAAGEPHEGPNFYNLSLYKLKSGKFIKIRTLRSRHMYSFPIAAARTRNHRDRSATIGAGIKAISRMTLANI